MEARARWVTTAETRSGGAGTMARMHRGVLQKNLKVSEIFKKGTEVIN
jgi:hypothetical protein